MSKTGLYNIWYHFRVISYLVMWWLFPVCRHRAAEEELIIVHVRRRHCASGCLGWCLNLQDPKEQKVWKRSADLSETSCYCSCCRVKIVLHLSSPSHLSFLTVFCHQLVLLSYFFIHILPLKSWALKLNLTPFLSLSSISGAPLH